MQFIKYYQRDYAMCMRLAVHAAYMRGKISIPVKLLVWKLGVKKQLWIPMRRWRQGVKV
jgi:hypothetical protein